MPITTQGLKPRKVITIHWLYNNRLCYILYTLIFNTSWDFPSADLMINRLCLLEVSLDWLDKGFRKRMNPFSYRTLHLTITSFLKAPCLQLMIEENVWFLYWAPLCETFLKMILVPLSQYFSKKVFCVKQVPGNAKRYYKNTLNIS